MEKHHTQDLFHQFVEANDNIKGYVSEVLGFSQTGIVNGIGEVFYINSNLEDPVVSYIKTPDNLKDLLHGCSDGFNLDKHKFRKNREIEILFEQEIISDEAGNEKLRPKGNLKLIIY